MGIEFATLLASLCSETDRSRLGSGGGKCEAKSAETHVIKMDMAAVTSTGDPVMTGDDVSEPLTTG